MEWVSTENFLLCRGTFFSAVYIYIYIILADETFQINGKKNTRQPATGFLSG
jgi:hypothetical protein